jgi:hypothetical protein
MSITGPGSVTALNVAAVTNMNNQLNQLNEELATGDAAQTYSGLGSQAGVALSLNAQLSAITGYTTAATTAGTTTTVRLLRKRRPRPNSTRFCRCSTPRLAAITCSPAMR